MIPSHGGSLPSLHMPPHKGDSEKQKSRHPKDDGATAEDVGFDAVAAKHSHSRYHEGQDEDELSQQDP